MNNSEGMERDVTLGCRGRKCDVTPQLIAQRIDRRGRSSGATRGATCVGLALSGFW